MTLNQALTSLGTTNGANAYAFKLLSIILREIALAEGIDLDVEITTP